MITTITRHLRDTRLHNNAGMDFPTCQAGAKLLDTDKGHWRTTPFIWETQCKNCHRIWQSRQRLANQVRDMFQMAKSAWHDLMLGGLHVNGHRYWWRYEEGQVIFNVTSDDNPPSDTSGGYPNLRSLAKLKGDEQDFNPRLLETFP